MTLDISCAFATSLDTPEHVVLAEQLGYKRAWLYDSPALYPDVWVSLAECARRTSVIELGPGVLVPSLRHPMTNAAAIAHLASLAPGRLNVAIGSGFTGRLTLGQRPLKWTYVRDYILCIQRLLAGEIVDWEGGAIQMMHPAGYGAERPIDMAIIVASSGPKGEAVARELGDGVFSTSAVSGHARSIVLTFGTVRQGDEAFDAPRVIDAAGHGAAVGLHAMVERGMDVTALPGGSEWLAQLHATPEHERHLPLHDLHLIGVNDHDRPMLTADFMKRAGGVRTPDEWRAHLDQLEAAGATEVAYQPAGPDIEGELRTFMQAAEG